MLPFKEASVKTRNQGLRVLPGGGICLTAWVCVFNQPCMMIDSRIHQLFCLLKKICRSVVRATLIMCMPSKAIRSLNEWLEPVHASSKIAKQCSIDFPATDLLYCDMQRSNLCTQGPLHNGISFGVKKKIKPQLWHSPVSLTVYIYRLYALAIQQFSTCWLVHTQTDPKRE